MAYIIPQKLQYEEKLLFGLTGKQLVYALIFLPIVGFLFKSEINMWVKITLEILVVVIAISFMFCNLKGFLANIYHWLKFKEVWLMDKRMKKFVGVVKIEKGVLYVRN